MTRFISIAAALRTSLSPEISSVQLGCDALSSQFFNRATEWQGLASMTLGSLGYHCTRLALANLGLAASLPVSITRFFAPLVAVGAEVSLFRASSQFLKGESSPDSWLTTFTHFSCLKGMTGFVRAQNAFIQQASQTLALVAGAELCGRLGLSDKPVGCLAERIVSAAVENAQMQAGSFLASMGTGHFFHSLERNLAAGQQRSDLSRAIRKTQHEECAPLTMHNTSLLEEYLNLYDYSWQTRLTLWSWKLVDQDAIQDLAKDYTQLKSKERRMLFDSIRQDISEARNRSKIGEFVSRLSTEAQIELVIEFCNVARTGPDTLQVMLDFASLHPLMKMSAKSQVAHELRMAQSYVEYEKTWQEEFEGRILDAWAEVIPELPMATINAERSRPKHLERFLKLARRPGYEGLRATLSLGSMILRAGWTRDTNLLDAFFSYSDLEENALGDPVSYRAYISQARLLIQVMDSSYQTTRLEALWNSATAQRWRARAVFHDLVTVLPDTASQLNYYKRYEKLLNDDEDVAVSFAIEKLDGYVLHLMDLPNRAALLSRIAARLSDKNPEVVYATCTLFENHLNSVVPHLDEVLEAITRNVETVSREGALGIDHIKTLADAIPRARRAEFVRRSMRTVQRILMGT